MSIYHVEFFTSRFLDLDTEAPILCHLMQRANSLEKTLMLGKTEGRRRRGHDLDAG